MNRKKYNTASKSGIFLSLDDAHYCGNKLGGSIHYIRKCDDEDIISYHDLTDEHENYIYIEQTRGQICMRFLNQ